MHTVDEVESMREEATWMPWFVCFIASLFFFYEFIQGNMFASIADDIMRDFHIQADSMASMSSIYYLSNVIFLFIAGYILDRFSAKWTILLAMLICVLSTFMLARAESFYVASVCRFMTGIGSAFCFLGPIRIASHWFSPKRMALVTGLIVTMAMTGGMVSQYPLTKLVAEFGWRQALDYLGWLGLFMVFVMALFIQDNPQHHQTRPHLKQSELSILERFKMAYLNIQSLRAALYTSLMNMAIAVFGAMMGPLYLMQRLPIDKPEASIINSMLFLGAIVGGPLMGWCSDKIGKRVKPMRWGAALSLMVILAILYFPVSSSLMMGLFFLLGVFTGAQVISYAFVSENSAPQMTATAVSLISILTQGGYILYQKLFGWMLIAHGDVIIKNGIPVYSMSDYQYASIMLPIGLVIAFGVLWGLNESKLKQHQG